MFFELILLIGWFHQLNCKSIKSSFAVELKDPIIRNINDIKPNKPDEFWLEQFFYILFNYSTLLVPILCTVYLVKNNLCCLPGKNLLFVFLLSNLVAFSVWFIFEFEKFKLEFFVRTQVCSIFFVFKTKF